MTICIVKHEKLLLDCPFSKGRYENCFSCQAYQAGKVKPAYPVPAIHNDYILRPLVRGYWALYWYRMGYARTQVQS